MYFFKVFLFILLLSTSLSYGQKCSPLPKDKTKLPTSLEREMKAIANLCNLKTYEQKVRSLERSLENLKKCIPYYESFGDKSIENAEYMISHGLRAMQFLYENTHMQVYWGYLFNDDDLKNTKSGSVLERYLFYRSVGYGIRSDDAMNPNKAYTTFNYDWEHDVYRGFYCMTFINPPPYKRTTQ